MKKGLSELLSRFTAKMYDAGGIDWFIARDAIELNKVVKDHSWMLDEFLEVARVLPPWKRITRIDDVYAPEEAWVRRTRWVWLWCLISPSGFFMSTEW